MDSKKKKIKELQNTLESVKQELESLKNEKDVLVWEDLDRFYGYDPHCDGSIREYTGVKTHKDYSHATFKTKEQAEAAIALAKISQLLPVYNEGWTPDWNNADEDKFAIYFSNEMIETDTGWEDSIFLSFKTEEIRDKFLKHNRELIEQAKPLL